MLRKLAIALGATAIVLGLAFTLAPLGSNVGVACGNAWTNGDDVDVLASEQVEAACAAVRADRWLFILSFVVLGAASLLAGLDDRTNEQATARRAEQGSTPPAPAA